LQFIKDLNGGIELPNVEVEASTKDPLFFTGDGGGGRRRSREKETACFSIRR
jgi:hypothetical protein